MFYFIVYGVLFLGMIVMGEELLLFAAALSHWGLLNFWVTMLVALAGAYVGDFLFFWLGWRFGEKFIDKFGKFLFMPRKRFEKIRHIFHNNHGKWLLFGSKFIYGLNHLTQIAAGSVKFNPKIYVKNQIYTTLIYIVIFATLGYAFSSVISLITKDVKVLGLFILVIIGVIVFISRLIDLVIERIYP